MQWKIDNFSEKIKNLTIKGKTIDDFKDFNDKNMSTKDFLNALFYTLHPFEIKNYTKILSPTQKAITMAIYMHGGYASEGEIVDFLNRHWAEITSVSKQNFARKPDSRLLHMNMSIKKEGLYVFVKKPDNPLMIGVNNANANEANEYVSDDSAQEDLKPMKSRERSKRSPNEDTEASNNNSDSSLADMYINKEDNDDDDDVKSSDYQSKSRRGGRMRGRQRSDNSSSNSSGNIRETRSKKDKKSNYGYSSDEKEKQSQDNVSNSSEYSSGNIKPNDYHYGRGMKRFNIEPIHQTPSLSSAVPVRSVGSSINMMKINSTLILPPIQKDPIPSYSILTSKPTEGEDNEIENKDLGTGLSVNWDWCNFSMSTAERILFFPLAKPFESSVDSIQNDSRFDFNIPEHFSFEEIVVFVVDEACSRASNFNSKFDSSKCGINIDQIAEKVRDFKKKEGMFASLPLNRRVRAVLLEAKEIGLIENEFIGEKEVWFPKRMNKKENCLQNKFKISLPKPFSSLKIKELTISQMFERFAQDQVFGLKYSEFLP